MKKRECSLLAKPASTLLADFVMCYLVRSQANDDPEEREQQSQALVHQERQAGLSMMTRQAETVDLTGKSAVSLYLNKVI